MTSCWLFPDDCSRTVAEMRWTPLSLEHVEPNVAGLSPFQYARVGPAQNEYPEGSVTDEYDDAQLT
jgi:hypothetical protein